MMGLFSSKSRTEQAKDQVKKQWDRLDLDADDLRKKAKRQWDDVDDLQKIRDELQKKAKNLHLPRHHEEPESSSAGFIAGVAVGVLLGVVLAYLFGKQGGSEMVDQFAHRAEELKETATDKYHQVRDRAEGESDQAVGGFGDGPAIEREFDDGGDDLASAAEAAVQRAKDSVENGEKHSGNALT